MIKLSLSRFFVKIDAKNVAKSDAKSRRRAGGESLGSSRPKEERKEKIDQETIYRNIESIIIKIMELLFQPKRDLNIEEAKR